MAGGKGEGGREHRTRWVRALRLAAGSRGLATPTRSPIRKNNPGTFLQRSRGDSTVRQKAKPATRLSTDGSGSSYRGRAREKNEK